MRTLAMALAMVISLSSSGPATASGGGAKSTGGEEYFTINELRVPLADSDPIRIMTVRLLLVMDTAESKAAVRPQQKALEQALIAALSQIPTQTATKPGAPIDVKKIVSQSIHQVGIKGVKDVLLQKYLLW